MQIKKKIMSIIELVPSTIDGILKDLSLHVKIKEDDVFNLRLILEEAITNGIKHGNDYNTGQTVEISVEMKGDVCEMIIEDQGEGFDYVNVADPMKEEELKSSGRGIYLVKKIADEVEFNETGSRIRILKKVELVKSNS